MLKCRFKCSRRLDWTKQCLSFLINEIANCNEAKRQICVEINVVIVLLASKMISILLNYFENDKY